LFWLLRLEDASAAWGLEHTAVRYGYLARGISPYLVLAQAARAETRP
jgi:hypothetical protein